jgi:hypothetical protein
MGKKKGNFIEAIGEDDYTSRDAGKKKPHARQRRSIDVKYREANEFSAEREIEETPPPASNLHIVARIPDKKAAVQEPLPAESDSEKIAKLEEKIQSNEFNDDERRYIDRIIKDYGKDVHDAKKNIEDGGGVVGDKWIGVFRTSHIEKCKTWGLKRQLAPEKAELIGKYLELKLPVGIPEEKTADNPEKNKNIYSGEKSKAFLGLLKKAGKYFRDCFKDSEQWGDEYGDEEARKNLLIERLQAALPGYMAQNQELKKHFPEEDAPMVAERVIKHIKIFNNIK